MRKSANISDNSQNTGRMQTKTTVHKLLFDTQPFCVSQNSDPLVSNAFRFLPHYLKSALSMMLICINLHANYAAAVFTPG